MERKQMSSTCPHCFKIFNFFIKLEEFENHWETKWAYCTHCGLKVYFSFWLIQRLSENIPPIYNIKS